MEWIKNLLSEGQEASMMRFCFFIIVAGFVINWIGIVFTGFFTEGGSTSISYPDVIVILGAFLFKVTHKRVEALRK